MIGTTGRIVVFQEADGQYHASLKLVPLSRKLPGQVFVVEGTGLIGLFKEAREEARRRGIPYVNHLDEPEPSWEKEEQGGRRLPER